MAPADVPVMTLGMMPHLTDADHRSPPRRTRGHPHHPMRIPLSGAPQCHASAVGPRWPGDRERSWC